jgi:hypothetical protein
LGLTDQLSTIDSRVGAIENEGIDETSILSKIFKVYGELNITTQVTVKKHQFKMCGPTVICGPNTLI